MAKEIFLLNKNASEEQKNIMFNAVFKQEIFSEEFYFIFVNI